MMRNKQINKAVETIASMCVDLLMGGLSDEMFVFNIKMYAKMLEKELSESQDEPQKEAQ